VVGAADVVVQTRRRDRTAWRSPDRRLRGRTGGHEDRTEDLLPGDRECRHPRRSHGRRHEEPGGEIPSTSLGAPVTPRRLPAAGGDGAQHTVELAADTTDPSGSGSTPLPTLSPAAKSRTRATNRRRSAVRRRAVSGAAHLPGGCRRWPCCAGDGGRRGRRRRDDCRGLAAELERERFRCRPTPGRSLDPSPPTGEGHFVDVGVAASAAPASAPPGTTLTTPGGIPASDAEFAEPAVG